MPEATDLIYVALFALAWPAYDYFVDWPRFRRRLRENPGRARLLEYRGIVFQQWLLVAAGVALWLRAGRPWGALGLVAPEGWRLWASAAAAVLLAALFTRNAYRVAHSDEKKERVRKGVGRIGALLPRTNEEFGWFLAVSLTAGVCEEFLFRGYFIWALQPALGWWGAAAAGAVCFGLMHAYQGVNGIISTALTGVLFTLVVWATRSLVPAMLLHAMLDAGNGLVIWLSLRGAPPAGAVEVSAAAKS
jgi:membrane protease YdiL (CAAX protease family)